MASPMPETARTEVLRMPYHGIQSLQGRAGLKKFAGVHLERANEKDSKSCNKED